MKIDPQSSDSPESSGEKMEENEDKENNPNFQSNLFVGQQVDVLDTVGRWTEAEILKVNKERQRIYVTYIYWSSKFDEWVDINEGRIAPLFTHTYNPPNALKIGQRIEAMDSRCVWLEAFVIDETDSEVKVHYKSWDVKFDEWLGRDSGRIRRFGPHGKNKGKPAKQWSVPVLPGAKPAAPQGTSNPQSQSIVRTRQITALSEMYMKYKAALAAQGLTIVGVEGDGNCLFRSVSHQVYGDDRFHDIVRAKCMDYMEVNSAFFSQFVVGGMDCFHMYLSAKRTNGVWGDDPEIQAMCELYGRPAMIYAHCPQRGARCLRTFHEAAAAGVTSPASALSHTGQRQQQSAAHPMRLSYYGGGHYDSIVDTCAGAPGSCRDNQQEDSEDMIVVPQGGDSLSDCGSWSMEAPGVLEERAINRARSTLEAIAAAAAVANVGRDVEAEAKSVSDREATDRVALELAVEASRADLTDWGDEDLEACLMLSVQDELTGQSESQPQAYKQKDAISSHSTAGTPASPGVSGREAVDVLQSQEELMRSAAAQSEQEFLQKALEDSLKSASARDDMEEALLESARIASLQGTDLGGGGRIAGRGGGKAQIVGDENDADVQLAIELSQLSEDELLQRTLQESLKQQPQQMPMQYEGALSQRTGAGASTAYSSRGNTGGGNRSMGFPCADSVTIPPPSSLQSDEDAELQEAIRLSMQQQPQQQRITGNNGDGMTDDEIAAAELEAAIQASMREI